MAPGGGSAPPSRAPSEARDSPAPHGGGGGGPQPMDASPAPQPPPGGHGSNGAGPMQVGMSPRFVHRICAVALLASCSRAHEAVIAWGIESLWRND